MKRISLLFILFLFNSPITQAKTSSDKLIHTAQFVDISQLTWHTPPTLLPLTEGDSNILKKHPVSVQFQVKANGVVAQHYIVASSQNNDLDEKILNSVRNVRFMPYSHQNKPISFYTIQEFVVKEAIIIEDDDMTLEDFFKLPYQEQSQ